MGKIVRLNKEETEECKKVSLMDGRDKSEQWTETAYRKGFASYSTFLGCVGEKAVSKTFFDGTIDQSVSFLGDGGKDFIHDGTKIDIKCQVSEADWAVKDRGTYGGFYVMAVDKNNREKELKYDMVFFTVVDSVTYQGKPHKENEDKRKILRFHWKDISEISIELCGYIWKNDILKNKSERKAPTLVTSKGGNSYNYYIKREELKLPCCPAYFEWILELE